MADACHVHWVSCLRGMQIYRYMGPVDVLVLLRFWSALELVPLEMHSFGFLLV